MNTKSVTKNKNKIHIHFSHLLCVFFLCLQIDIEASNSHPFFVYGKGWASVSPDNSKEDFGLKCQPLEVGDICISLKPRDSSQNSGTVKTAPKLQSSAHPFTSHQPQYYGKPDNLAPNGSVSLTDHVPQNLSRKSHTTPTTATSTAVTSRPLQPYDYQQLSYNHVAHLHQQQQQHKLVNDQHSEIRSQYNHRIDERRVPMQRTLSHDSSPRKYNGIDPTMPPPPAPSFTADNERNMDTIADEAMDATTRSNRKRRWSAPDNICNVDGCQLEQKKCTKH